MINHNAPKKEKKMTMMMTMTMMMMTTIMMTTMMMTMMMTMISTISTTMLWCIHNKYSEYFSTYARLIDLYVCKSIKWIWNINLIFLLCHSFLHMQKRYIWKIDYESSNFYRPNNITCTTTTVLRSILKAFHHWLLLHTCPDVQVAHH